MYAVIETGGKQYRVAPGETVDVESIPGEVGSEIELGRVLAVVEGEEVKAGAAAGGARVKGTIVAHDRGEQRLMSARRRLGAERKLVAGWAAVDLLGARPGGLAL